MSSSGQQPGQFGNSGAPAHLPVPSSLRPAPLAGLSIGGVPWGGVQETADGVNLVSLLHSLRRRWLVGSGVGILIASVIGAILWLIIPVNFEAVSLLRVRRHQEDIMGNASSGRTSEFDYETYRATQAQLFKSPYVISAALRKPGITQLPMVRVEENQVSWLASEIEVDYPGKSEVLRISMRGPDPTQIITLVDAVRDAYMEEIVHAERAEWLVKLDVLRRSYRKTVDDIKARREVIFRLAETLGTPEIESVRTRIDLALRNLNSLKEVRDNLEREYQRAEIRYILAEQSLQNRFYVPSRYAIEDELDKDPFYAEQKLILSQLEEEARNAGGMVRGAAPGGSRFSSQVQAKRAQLVRIRREKEPQITERLARQHFGMDEAEQEQALILLDTERRLIYDRWTEADKKYKAEAEQIRQMGGASADLMSRKDELASLVHMATSLKGEIDVLDLNLQRPPRITLIQEAIVPDKNDRLVKWVEIAGVWILAFAGTVVCIALWDYQGKRLNSARDVASGTGLEVIGALPALNGRRVGALWPFSHMDRRSLEVVLNYSIDSIRTALLYNHSDRPIKIVMVTSAKGQEGKTTVASQLAVSLARSGRRTLLIDGDLRNPQQHLVFGLPFGRGLCEMLRHEAELDDVIQPTAAEGLSLVTAGYCDQLSLRAMSNETLREIFAALRQRFEFIVLDTGPVLTGADPLLLGQHADAALLSVRRDISQTPKIYAANERLRSVGIHVMGVVVNGTSTEVRRSDLKLAQHALTHAEATAEVDVDDEEPRIEE